MGRHLDRRDLRRRIRPADRESFRRFLRQFDGMRVEAALEATTGWRFVVSELERAGHVAHLAEPAETAALRGRKKRAKSDRADARHLRKLLCQSRLPESWIPPQHILELRSRVRLRHTLQEQRTEWQQRIQAQLYHHGVPQRSGLPRAENRTWLAELDLPEAARAQIEAALSMIDHLDAQLEPLDRELRAHARRQPGCRALMSHYGIGELIAATILAELGDPRRFSSSRRAVRYAGMDITVHESDRRRAPGHLSRQGPPALRWALYEAAHQCRRSGSPDRDYYARAAERIGGSRACLSIARKLLKRAYHTLARARRGGASAGLITDARHARHQLISRGRLPACSRRRAPAPDDLERPSGRTAFRSGITPSTIMSPVPCQGPWTEIRLGARAHEIEALLPGAHAPPAGMRLPRCAPH